MIEIIIQNRLIQGIVWNAFTLRLRVVTGFKIVSALAILFIFLCNNIPAYKLLFINILKNRLEVLFRILLLLKLIFIKEQPFLAPVFLLVNYRWQLHYFCKFLIENLLALVDLDLDVVVPLANPAVGAVLPKLGVSAGWLWKDPLKYKITLNVLHWVHHVQILVDELVQFRK